MAMSAQKQIIELMGNLGFSDDEKSTVMSDLRLGRFADPGVQKQNAENFIAQINDALKRDMDHPDLDLSIWYMIPEDVWTGENATFFEQYVSFNCYQPWNLLPMAANEQTETLLGLPGDKSATAIDISKGCNTVISRLHARLLNLEVQLEFRPNQSYEDKQTEWAKAIAQANEQVVKLARKSAVVRFGEDAVARSRQMFFGDAV